MRCSPVAADRPVRALAVLLSALSIGGYPLRAQTAPTSSSGSRAGDPVQLRMHPRVGDTLHTRLEQQMEVTGERGHGSAIAPRPMTTSVTVSARTVVQASRARTTTVLTIVDSAEIHSSDARGAAMSAQAERSLRGQRLVLQLAEDGTVQSARDARGVSVPPDMAEAMAAMPAVFPSRPVSVGERWDREMPLPTAGALGTKGSAHVLAHFRLDSLGRKGELAYVSLHGDIVSDADAKDSRLSGTLSGAMLVDRVRGWMTDSRFSVMIKSLVTPPPASGMAPMHFVTKLTQHLRTMDKR